MVLYVDQPFPCCLAAERVIVVFNKAVDKVHCAEGILHPLYIIFVPEFQVPRPVIFDKGGNILLLGIVFRIFCRFFKFRTYPGQGRAVQPAGPVHFFPYHPVGALDHLAVQPV